MEADKRNKRSSRTENLNDLRADAERVAPTLNATDPDLSAFRKRGGKLLMYTGWTDPAITTLGTIEYYEGVMAHDASAADDVRLIMMPGVDHCFGGVGPDWVNFLDEINTWVEFGEAPEQATAYWLNEQMQPDGSRPECAYPKYVRYNGTGTLGTPRVSAARPIGRGTTRSHRGLQ